MKPCSARSRRCPLQSEARRSDVTRLLAAIPQGDPRAAEELLRLVSGELRSLPAGKWRASSRGKRFGPPRS